MRGRRRFGEKKLYRKIQRIPIYQSSLKLEQILALVYQGTPQRGDADISARKNYTGNPKDSGIYQGSLKIEQNPALVYQGTPQRGDADISARKKLYQNPFKPELLRRFFVAIFAKNSKNLCYKVRYLEVDWV